MTRTRTAATRAAGFGARVNDATAFLLAPVDLAWLAAFRVLFGLALAFSMQRFLANGWVARFFVAPAFYFKYWGFEWVEPLPGPLMHALFAVLVGLALAVAAGFAFRIAAFAFAIGLSYVQLIDVSTYLNHYYLAALLAFLLAVSPANRAYSVDAWLARRVRSLRTGAATAPAGTGASSVARAWLYLFRFQVGVVYVFAGLAKAQSDWLVHAQPLRIWLGNVTELPLLGSLVTLPFVPLVFAWCGFYDTTIVAFLLWNRTRPYAYCVVIVFHVLTRVIFPIGMFPVIMILSALVFFSPSWPRLVLSKAGRLFARLTGSGSVRSEVALPKPPLPSPSVPHAWILRAALALGAAYCCLHLLLPLRHFAYGGNVLWHEQGMRFSWRVMLRAKGGSTTFLVKSPETGRRFYVQPREYLNQMQENEMSSQPDLIVQLAHHIQEDFARRGFGQVQVYAESRVSLNGRRSVPFVDPRADLTRVSDGFDLKNLVLPPPSEVPPHTRPVL